MRITLPNLLSLLCLIGSIMLTQPLLAKTYKWVDENGVTQYTATPPPTGDFKAIKAPSKPAVDPAKAQSELEKRLEAFTKRKDDTNKAQKEADDAATKTAESKKNCEQAKKNLNLLITKVRVRYKEKDGSSRYLTDDEREANMKRAQDAIKKYCK